MAEERIALRVAEEGGLARQWPLTTGLLPRGAVGDSGSLWQARHRVERGLVRRGDGGVHRDLALRNQTRGVRVLRPGGAVCRHLGRAYQLSGERRYLEVGQRLLQQLIVAQDWGDDPRKRGAVAMNPTAFSLRSGGQIPRFASEDR